MGKGLTFDSGGYNLKVQGGIETMKCDMVSKTSWCSAESQHAVTAIVCACADTPVAQHLLHARVTSL